MDTSKDYLNMCIKAVEIQEAWVPMRGDRVVVQNHSELKLKEKVIRFLHQEEADSICALKMGSRKFEVTERIIFCPRQDQLQGLVVDRCDAFMLMLEKLNRFVKSSLIKATSMEQLWLSLVMKEKFKKIWGGEDWK